MKKKYHLEVIRILAILMVMYNHSAAFMSFSNQSGVEYAISFLFSMVCKGAVPLFFMVSGALLLGKNESGKDLFQKRILRMILVIVIFSFLYYMKLVLKGERLLHRFRFCCHCRRIWYICRTGFYTVISVCLRFCRSCAHWHRICRKIPSGI